LTNSYHICTFLTIIFVFVRRMFTINLLFFHTMNTKPCYNIFAEGKPEADIHSNLMFTPTLNYQSPIIPISWQMSFLKRRLVCFYADFVINNPSAIDKCQLLMYNVITLSRAAEETGPLKPGNLTFMSRC